MKTLRIVILDEDGSTPARPGEGEVGHPTGGLAGLDPRRLEGLSGPAAAALLREHAQPLSFLDTDAGGLDALGDRSTSLEDRVQEALRGSDADAAPRPVLLVPPRDEGAATRGRPTERLGERLMRVLRRHELEAALGEAQARLAQIGLRDGQHGLPRRELFVDRLEQAALSVQRGGASFTLLMIGAELPAPGEAPPVADGAEAIEPTRPAAAASALLVETLTARLLRLGRRCDSYARMGGHSFAALLLGSSSVAASMSQAHRLAEDLARPLMVAGQPQRPQITIGVAMCPQHGSDARNLLLHAHAALEQAQAGRHAVAVYDPRYSRALHSPGEVGAATLPLQGEALAPLLEQALDRHEIGLALQPVVDLCSGRILHIEALARWQLPAQGAVAPRDFVAVAEHHGLIGRLTDQVLDQALRAARGWRAAGLAATLSLNLSVSQLGDPEWPRRLRAALLQHDWPAQALQLEVSAPALLRHADADPQVRAELDALGVGLAVQGFGSGLGSMLSVAELAPLTQIGVDLADLRADARSATPESLRAILAAAVALAHGLGARLVVGGIEQAADLAALHELGVDGVQGRLCAAPMAPRQLRPWWQQHRDRPLAWQHPTAAADAPGLDIDCGRPSAPA
ncbi:MAG: EAL domain-containing protein [Burkholderiaceae bacterium]|nr:EAL domain-containing protein [Burkholderiaceae bacterium]